MTYRRGRSIAGLSVWLGLATLGCSPGRVIDTSSTDASGSETDETDPTDPTDPTDDSTSTNETDPSETTTEDNTATFFPDQDISGPSACYTWEQDCPEGEKCVPYASENGSWEAEKCVPVLGEGLPGDPCTHTGWVEATDDCGADSMCVGSDPSEPGMGFCVEFCDGTPDDPECPEGTKCSVCGDYCPPLCIPSCDPLLQDCGEDQACYYQFNGDFNCAFTTQDIPPGQPCGFINDCEGGSFCASAEFFPDCEGSACCSPFCDLDLGDEQCAAIPGTMCIPFFEPDAAPPGLDKLGVCIVM